MPDECSSAAVECVRLRLLFRQARSASLVGALSAIACTAVFLLSAPGAAPLIWFGAVIGATGLRLALYRRFFATETPAAAAAHWLRRHAQTAALVGLGWGSLPLLPLAAAPDYVQEAQILVPGFVLMAAITSYGVYYTHYLVLLVSMVATAVTTNLIANGVAGVPSALLLALFAPALAITAKRYGASLVDSLRSQQRSRELVRQLTATNAELVDRNATLARQQALIEQEEALAQHVFRQLVLGGDHRIPGVHTWNQSMGSLSGDLTQTACGPDGQVYVFLGDFTGHGLPAALGALPASSVFLAMATKGLALPAIATELNRKLAHLLPVGYFCCAALLELAPDRASVSIWNGGLPPILIRRRGRADYEKIASHSLPLGVVVDEFRPEPQCCRLYPGDLLYAYTDGLTEAENAAGERWGTARLEQFLLRPDLASPRLPALIEAVLGHVDRAPASDDISVVEIEASCSTDTRADAA